MNSILFNDWGEEWRNVNIWAVRWSKNTLYLPINFREEFGGLFFWYELFFGCCCSIRNVPFKFDETELLLQEVDPCEDLTDDDIRTAIQNATGPRSALFVPEVGSYCVCFLLFSIYTRICVYIYIYVPTLL